MQELVFKVPFVSPLARSQVQNTVDYERHDRNSGHKGYPRECIKRKKNNRTSRSTGKEEDSPKQEIKRYNWPFDVFFAWKRRRDTLCQKRLEEEDDRLLSEKQWQLFPRAYHNLHLDRLTGTIVRNGLFGPTRAGQTTLTTTANIVSTLFLQLMNSCRSFSTIFFRFCPKIFAEDHNSWQEFREKITLLLNHSFFQFEQHRISILVCLPFHCFFPWIRKNFLCQSWTTRV